MKLPSKELLKEVLGSSYNDRLVDWYQIEDDSFLRSYYDCGRFDEEGRPTGLGLEINIYELMHLMKHNAMLRNYELLSSKPIVPDEEGRQVFNYWWVVKLLEFDGSYEKPIQIKGNFLGINEFEAVVEACEWILKQEVAKPLSACCGAPFIENSEMCYPHDGIVGQCSKCMEFSEEQGENNDRRTTI